MNTQQLQVKYTDDGEAYFEFPEDMMERLGWTVGDDIKFVDNKDGSFMLKKVKYENVEMEFDEEELCRYMHLAHERGQSFDDFVNDALLHALQQHDTK